MFADDTPPVTEATAQPSPYSEPPAVEPPPAPEAQGDGDPAALEPSVGVPLEPEPRIETIHSVAYEPTVYIRLATEAHPVPEGARRFPCPQCNAVHAVWTDQQGRAGTLQFQFSCHADGCDLKAGVGIG